MGPVQRQMLAKLDAAPDGAGGLRRHEVSAAAVRHGWARWCGDLSDAVAWYEITAEGRRRLHAWREHNPGRLY